MKERIILFLIIVIFVIHALSLNFTQDDAFISYRYVKNFTGGHGLVFNPGERVEGYTNFLWIIILSFFSQLGINIIVVSKILGVTAGALTLFLTYRISGVCFGKKAGLFTLIGPLLLASNSAFAYWSISGLETTFFVITVLLSVYLYFTHERLVIITSAVSTLIRPEGVLVFAIFILHKFFFNKNNLGDCLLYILGFSLLLLPFLVFKIFYYGDILPNPFYAKTGLSLEYLKSGLSYFGLFLKHYGLWGVLYLLPAVVYKDFFGFEAGGRVKYNLFLLVAYVYTLYIIVIGGDVLKAHRFFLPIVPLLYLLFAFVLRRLYGVLKKKFSKRVVPLLMVVAFSAFTFWLPRNWILGVRAAEVGLYDKMSLHAERMKQSFGTHFTLSVSTIGSISYLTDARVIDMLGLTDPYIARHPEKISGIASTWHEKKFNTQYLLSLDPDVIMFSTGVKPSAPAEKALFLSSKFRGNYYPYYFTKGFSDMTLYGVYKRKGKYSQENKIFLDVRFIDLYAEAVYLESRGDLQACLDRLKKIIEVGPNNFAWAYELMGKYNFLMGNIEQAKIYSQKAIALDDYCTIAHVVLYNIYLAEGDTTAVLQEEEKLLLYNPELLELR